jgi:hypothetical protein
MLMMGNVLAYITEEKVLMDVSVEDSHHGGNQSMMMFLFWGRKMKSFPRQNVTHHSLVNMSETFCETLKIFLDVQMPKKDFKLLFLNGEKFEKIINLVN